MSECSQNLASKSSELLHWTDISKKFRICPLYQPKCQFCPTGNSSVYGMPTMRTPEQWDLRDTSSEHGVRSPDCQSAILAVQGGKLGQLSAGQQSPFLTVGHISLRLGSLLAVGTVRFSARRIYSLLIHAWKTFSIPAVAPASPTWEVGKLY